MKIVILGWGSLIWNPGNLHIEGSWREDGPFLPIEFARVSGDRRLTLVLNLGSASVQTLWALSAYRDLNQARKNLRERERTSIDKVGYVSIPDNESNSQAIPQASDCIRKWATEKELDAVIWTDLEANFSDKTKTELTTENVIAYLNSLTKESRDKAIEYIRNAPAQIDTILRRRIIKAIEV